MREGHAERAWERARRPPRPTRECVRTDRSSDQRHTASCRAAPSSRENRKTIFVFVLRYRQQRARLGRRSARARGACVCAMPTSCGSDRRPAFDGLARGAVLKTGSTQVHQLLDRAVSRAGAVARSSWWCDPIFQTCQWREEHACTPFELQLTRAERREASGLGSRDLRRRSVALTKKALTAPSPRRAPHACIGSRIGWR